MNSTMKALVLTSLLALALSGCHQSNAIPSTTGDLYTAEQVAGTELSEVYRFHDTEVGAVCYVMTGLNGRGGIYCIDRGPIVE